MKNSGILSVLAIASLLFSCTNKPDDIVNDFKIHINPSFYSYVVEVQLQDISDPNERFTERVEVTIDGEDAEAIYNIDGTRNYEVNHGTLMLMVLRDNEPTEGDPLNFDISFESNKYRKLSLPVVIEAGNYYVIKPAPLLDLTNLPSGMGSNTASEAMSGDTLQQEMNLVSSSSDGTAEVEMEVPTTTKFKDANGQILSGGSLEAVVLCYSDTADAARKAMPAGTGYIQKINIHGDVVDVLLPKTPIFEINMSVGGQEVKSFDGEPVKLKIPVADDMYNYGAQRPYIAGDTVGLISLSEGDAAWVYEQGEYVVAQGTDGKLFLEAGISHLSHYGMAPPPAPPAPSGGFGGFGGGHVGGGTKINIGVDPSAGPQQLSGRVNVAVSDVSGQQRTLETNGPYTTPPSVVTGSGASNTTPPSIAFSSPGGVNGVTVQGHSLGSGGSGGGLGGGFQFSGGPVPPGEGENEWDIVIVPPEGLRAHFTMECASGYASPPSGVRLFYRLHEGPNNQKAYTPLFSFISMGARLELMSNEYINLPALNHGEFYDFRAEFGRHQIDTLNVEAIDEHIYHVKLPKVVCRELGL